MICQKCGKRDAGVILTQIANNTKSVVYLCDECAKEMGVSGSFADAQALEETTPTDETTAQEESLKCPNCGLSFADFKQSGRLGCGNCYTAFWEKLEEMLTKLHGSTAHRGKLPHREEQRGSIGRDIIRLREELKTAIEKERFEEAAELRDRLAQMEKTAQNDN